MIFAQIESVVNASQGMQSTHQLTLLLSVLGVIALGLLIPIIKMYVEYLLKIQEKKLAFDEAEKQKDREFERQNLTEKHQSVQNTAKALLENAGSLKIATENNERLTKLLNDKERNCVNHKKLLKDAVDDTESISEHDANRLKEAIEANQNV